MKRLLKLFTFMLLLIAFVGCKNSPDLSGEWKSNDRYYRVFILNKEGDSYNIKTYQMHGNSYEDKLRKGKVYEYAGKLIDNTIDIDGYFKLQYSPDTDKMYEYTNSGKKFELNRVK